MRPAEAGKLLAVCAAFDNRKPDPSGMAAAAWAEALGGLDYDDCVKAITRHYAATDRYIMPSHVRAGALAIRERRQQEELNEERRRQPIEPRPSPEYVPMPEYVKDAWRKVLAARQLPTEDGAA